MKVWALEGFGPYEGSYLLEIYSTKEKAQQAEKKWEQSDNDMEYEITEWEVE